MFGKSSFLRNLGGLPPPTPPKTPSTISRRVSDEGLSIAPSSPDEGLPIDPFPTPSSGRYPSLHLSAQNSTSSNHSSLYPSLDIQEEAEYERSIRRRPRRANGGSGIAPGSVSTGSPHLTSRQSIYALDASQAKKMEEIGRQRRLQYLRQAESVAEVEDDDDGPPPVPKKSKPNGAPPPPPPPPTPPPVNPLPTPPPDDIPPSPAPISGTGDSDHAEDVKALENLLNETVAELQAAKDYTKKLKAQHDADKSALLTRIKDLEKQNSTQKDESVTQKDVINQLTRKLSNFQNQLDMLQDQNEHQVDENATQNQTIEHLKAAAQKTQAEMSILAKEKHTWQQKLDGMHNRLHYAERQLRCLDHVTRAKLESRQSGLMADIKRNPLFASKGLGAEILNQVTALNQWIQPTAQLLAKHLVRSIQRRSQAQTSSRSFEILGEGTSALLQVHATQASSKLGRDFLQTVIELFMVHWATMIIEAWYPKQQSFADILADLSAQKQNSRAATRILCGAPVKILSTTPPATDFQNWATEMLKDLDGILLDADVAFPTPSRSDVQRNLVTLSDKAYNLRTSLAERDLCGNIQLAHISPDTLFQARLMEDVQAGSAGANRRGAATLTDAERVAGTCRLGLQIPGTTPEAAATLALKPKVVLLSKVNDSL